ncbi:MAG: hypothetical protein ABIS15_03285 [Gemmatimonadaceae bacterium]
MTALLIGTALAVASLCYVLYPLLRPNALAVPLPSRPGDERSSSAVDALRELEFDRQTGKISDDDYGPLKARYTEEALTVMRAVDAGAKSCPSCGPRPEGNAEFCSNCGTRLESSD